MIPILYQTATEGTVPTNYGIGALTDVISCSVKEERNGSFELSLQYPASGIHAEEIQPLRIIKAKPNYTANPQLFRIYKVGKTINGSFTVNAQHISYDLSGKIIQSGTAGSCVAACALLQAQAGNFTITTDKSVSGAFNVSQPSSVRSWFGGKEGSLLDVYGSGEWLFDNYAASLKVNRGADRGVTIRYGKNLTQLSQVLDMSNLVTAILPFCIVDDVKTVGTKVNTGLTLDTPREVAIDFSSEVDPESGTALSTQLANLANRYKNNNNLTQLTNSITLSFEQLEGLTERVDLCDTVHIYFEALGITATAKCVTTTWDVLQDRYSSCTFGDARTNIADTIASNTKQLETAVSRSYMAEAVDRATELITGNLGGYVVIYDSNGDGEPDEILIMDQPDISTATKVWRWNKSGLGYSSTGYGGTYGLAMTAAGEIVADFIKTGTLNADLIKAGVISDVQGNSTINMTNGEADLARLKARFDLTTADRNDNLKAFINAGIPGDGAIMRLYGGNNKSRIYMDGNPNGATGYFYDSSENVRLVLSSNSTNGYIAAVNSSNRDVAKVYATANGGYFMTTNNSGTSTTELFTNPSNNGALIISKNGATIIDCDGNNGRVTCVELVQTSSRKTKENIKPIEDARKILDLQAVSFDFKDNELGTDKRGFIAEDVAEVLPNLVKPETETANAALDYIGMIPYLQAVIKEQDERIKALEDKITQLGG